MTVSAPQSPRALPRPLKVVGIGLIVFGVLSALLSLGAFRRAPSPVLPTIRLAVQVTAIIAGVGVLRLHAGLRVLALVWLGFMMAFFGTSLIFTFTAEQPVLRPIASAVGNVMFVVVGLLLAAVCYRILTRADMQAEFYRPG